MSLWMDPEFGAGLDRALEGNVEERASLRLEMRRFVGGSGDERVIVDANGVVAAKVLRSIRDQSGSPIGEMQFDAGVDAPLELARRFRTLRAPGRPAQRPTPFALQTRLTIELGGVRREIAIFPGSELAPDLDGLFQRFYQLDKAARRAPRRTLALRLIVDAQPWVDSDRLAVTLRAENDGADGFFMTEPASFWLAAPRDDERCELLFVRAIRTQPGFSPPPQQVMRAPLESSGAPERMVWLEGHSSFERRLTARVALPPQALHARATWSSYARDDLVEGEPRLRGCAFSNEVVIDGRLQ